MSKLELYDCTLREGEQAAGASFDLKSRVELFTRLDDFGFDFIELGWPIASEDILKSFELCREIRKKAKIVAFGSTSIKPDVNEDANLASILKSKADYACIFGKSHLEHVEKQLKLTPEENLKRISDSISFLKKNGMPVFYDAEHYFDAFKEHKEYALSTLVSAIKSGAERIILCDTNGGTLPEDAKRIVGETADKLKEYNVKLGVHFHNDCGLALANALASLPFIIQMQGTINGIGERVGNLDFSEFIPVYATKFSGEVNVKMKELKNIAEFAYRLCGLDIPASRPFVGDYAFAHKGGVHIDAINKGANYEHITPEEFGNKRVIILNTLGGNAGVVAVAKQFHHELDKNNPEIKNKIKALFDELRTLEEKGYRIGGIEAEQYLLIEKYFGNLSEFFKVKSSRVETETIEGKETSRFFIAGTIDNEPVMEDLTVEGGPVDAAYKTLSKLLLKRYPLAANMKIVDFHVGIAKSNAEESTVRTVISFESRDEKFQAVGVDTNMFQSAVEALAKGFEYYLNRKYPKLNPPNSKLNKS